MRGLVLAIAAASAVVVIGLGYRAFRSEALTLETTSRRVPPALSPAEITRQRVYEPRLTFDSSGFSVIGGLVPEWDGQATLQEIAAIWEPAGRHAIARIDQQLARDGVPLDKQVELRLMRAVLLHYEAEPYPAYDQLTQVRELVQTHDAIAEKWLATVVYLQGVTALRCGETDNCIHCRGEGSCILPIRAAAIHTNPHGSRLAVRHFTEYLEWFPDDMSVRWLLNLAHMTLGEHPGQVKPRFLIEEPIDTEFAIGEFRDIGERVGVNRFNQAGGAIMEDFDNDHLLDIVTTSFDPTQAMSFLRNDGLGRFRESATEADLTSQLGGLYCVQTDFDNDGFVDIFIPRGAWLLSPIRPTLLRNNGDGTFADVTQVAGLLDPVNSNSAAWGDYDNDGDVDLYVCCERQPNRLFRNRGDGTFEEVAKPTGVQGSGAPFCKGATWLDYDNDRFLDLFVTYYQGSAQLFRNDRDGRFVDVTTEMGIDGPEAGFSCWSWDYDNDGWLDIFATCYDLKLEEVVAGMLGEPHHLRSNRLFHNQGGQRFVDRTRDVGLDHVYGTMGSNFGDFDNDGFLDMYLGTGDTSQTIHRHVTTGSSFGANPLEQNIGLGSASQIATLEIHWPSSNTTQVFRDVAVNQYLHITEGEPTYRSLDLPPIPVPMELP